jgi:exonuclease III
MAVHTQFHQTYTKGLKSICNANTVVVGDFNTLLSPIDRSSKQKINKAILELYDAINQMNLTDVYRVFHLTTAQYAFYSAAHGTFSKIYLILGHKASLSNIRKEK